MVIGSRFPRHFVMLSLVTIWGMTSVPCLADSASQQACVDALTQDPTQSFCAVETCAFRECIARQAVAITAGDIKIAEQKPTSIPAECYPDLKIMQDCHAEYIAKVTREAAQPALPSGAHKVVVFAQGGPYNSTWEITVSGTTISGKSSWQCCPHERVDPLQGSFSGRDVTIRRTCTGQGEKGPCDQVYTGRIQHDGIYGSFTHNGKDGGSWRLYFAEKETASGK